MIGEVIIAVLSGGGKKSEGSHGEERERERGEDRGT